MATYIDDRNRIIIPRWREYQKNNLSAEHMPMPANISKENYLQNDSLLELKAVDWQENHSVSTALELVSSSYAIGTTDISLEAARFLKEMSVDLPKSILHIVKEILGEETIEHTVTKYGDEKLNSLFRHIGGKLNSIRKRLIEYPNNPLLWIELARLHSILGNIKKAEKAIIVSLELSAGKNRFIIRAASRFYYHIDEYDRAHTIVRKSPFVKIDPWLMACEISYATKQEKFSPNIKRGLEIIKGANFSDSSISELSSMIGTLEFRNGSISNARRLTNKSLVCPNDNSLAQAEWLSRHISDISFNPWLNKIEYAYEANAYDFWYNKDYSKSMTEAFNWVLDQPFSKRAVIFASYLACELLLDYDNAIEICEFGLRVSPNSFTILNNLIYSLAQKNDITKAKTLLEKLPHLIESDIDKAVFSATDGLIDYRLGNHESGKEKYLKAIAAAKALKDSRLIYVAETNFILEEFRINKVHLTELTSHLKRIAEENKSSDLSDEINATLKKIEKVKSIPFKV